MKLRLPKFRLWPVRTSVRTAQPTNTPNRWPMSLRLLSWNSLDHVHLFDVLTHIQVFGATGSAKSTTTVAHFSRAFLLNDFGAVFFAVKPTDSQDYRALAEECGRGKDVVLLGPAHNTAMNFIDDGLGTGGPGMAANVTSLLSIVSGLAVGRSSASGGSGREDGSFWEKMDNRLIAACTNLMIRSGLPVTTLNLERLVVGLPRSREQATDPEWQRTSLIFQALRTADVAATCPEDREDVGRLADYFLIDMAQLGDKLRGTVQTSVGATLDLFNHPLTRRLLSSATPNFRMEMLQEGKILIVDMPAMTYGPLSVAIQKVLKFCFQLAQNRRNVASNPRPVAMICDESQVLVDPEHDALFACTARGTRTICLFSTQSISNYLAASPGTQGEARVSSLQGNLQLQIVHRTSDVKTLEHLQGLIGKRSRMLRSGGTAQQGADWINTAMGLAPNGNVNAGYAEQLEHEIQAEHCQALRAGGPPDWIAEAIVYQGGKTFASSGRPYLLARLPQKPNAL